MDALDKANASLSEAALRVQGDPARPAYHFQPPANWMNDPNGPIFFRGEYHVFYQLNPYGDTWATMHWGHAKSEDMVHWQHLPIALAPPAEWGEEHCFSGCAVVSDDGVPTLFYTSIGPETRAEDSAVQFMATSADGLVTWERHPANPVLTGDVHGDLKVRHWRDPFVWKDGGAWYMVLGGLLPTDHAAVFLYRSGDLVSWEFLAVLHQEDRPSGKSWECPSFFGIKDTWVLIVSSYGCVRYFTGTFDRSAFVFKPEHTERLDLGKRFYAANTFLDGDGRRIMYAWVRDVKGRGWSGMLTVPRVLGLGNEGRLTIEPIPELNALRRDHQSFHDFALSPDSPSFALGTAPNCAEVACRFERLASDAVGLEFRADDRAVPVCFEPPQGQLTVGDEAAPFELLPGEDALDLRVFLDRSVLEVYVNGRTTLTTALPFVEDGAFEGRVFARGGTALVASADLWRMESALETP